MKLFLLFFIALYTTKVLISPPSQKPQIRNLQDKKKLNNIYKKHTLFTSNNKYIKKQETQSNLKKNQNISLVIPHNNAQKRRYLENQINSEDNQINNNIQYNEEINQTQNLENIENPESSENSENVQNMEYPDKSLQEILNYSIDQSEKKNPVIIINHSENETREQNYINPIYEVPKKNTLDNLNEISIADIDTLILILNNIENLYSGFYQKLPEDPKMEKNPENLQNLNDYIKRLQIFTRDIMMNSDSLMSDMNYLENKIHKMQPGIEKMMLFYNLEEKFSKLKIQLTVTKDEKIRGEFKELTNYSEDYDIYEKNIKKYSYDLYKFNDFFAAQIKNINQDPFSGNQGDSVDQFDKVLMLSVRLIEIKVDLEKCLENLKEDFENLQTLGFDIEKTILNLGEKVEKQVIEIEKEKIAKDKGTVFVKEEGEWIWGVFTAVLVVLG